MPHPLTKKMADLHERVLADWFGGRQTRGSGNQWNGPADGRQDRYRKSFAFAWDGKSTRGQSIGVGRRMWNKVVDQAGGERPMLALRFYDTDSLQVGLDLAVICMDDLREMQDRIAELESVPVPISGPLTEDGLPYVRCPETTMASCMVHCLGAVGHVYEHFGCEKGRDARLVRWA